MSDPTTTPYVTCSDAFSSCCTPHELKQVIKREDVASALRKLKKGDAGILESARNAYTYYMKNLLDGVVIKDLRDYARKHGECKALGFKSASKHVGQEGHIPPSTCECKRAKCLWNR